MMKLRIKKLLIPRGLHEELMYFAGLFLPNECSGLGRVKLDVKGEDVTFRVTELLYVPQRNSGASTDLDFDSLAQKFGEDADPESIRLWWHSHGQMSSFWSGTDEATVKELVKAWDWAISLVVSPSKSEHKLRLDMKLPFGHVWTYDDLELELSDGISETRKLELKKLAEAMNLHSRVVQPWPGSRSRQDIPFESARPQRFYGVTPPLTKPKPLFDPEPSSIQDSKPCLKCRKARRTPDERLICKPASIRRGIAVMTEANDTCPDWRRNRDGHIREWSEECLTKSK